MSLFINDQKLVTNKELNIDNPTIFKEFDSQEKTWSDIFKMNTGHSYRDQRNLLKIGQAVSGVNHESVLLGGNATVLAFGQLDTKAMMSFAYDRPLVRVSSGNNPRPRWHEDIAWKSDIQRLESRISALEKKIGGGK